MKNIFNKSWKTTLGGTLTSTGVVLLGAVAFDWMPKKLQYGFAITGFVMTALGTFIGGLYARDNNVTSEQVQANKEK